MKDDKKEEITHYMPLYMCLGMAIGTGIGVVLDNMALYMCLGISLGVAVGAMLDAKNRKKPQDPESENEIET